MRRRQRKNGFVGWAKARSSRVVPTVLLHAQRDGGHGADAPYSPYGSHA
ncbi:hypothetical protein NK6_3495 [Bradyrhizobium diazoefficiens]|uniref:Uncharacterized protein n=1 Tax=Bradyrhizobium diazoefficiens TaxID=1355477 RepID=A0A0E4FTF7_9BRAD|nr:hypothetical protein NK6_3495 [Bradyrhizobium diazoefficiens]